MGLRLGDCQPRNPEYLAQPRHARIDLFGRSSGGDGNREEPWLFLEGPIQFQGAKFLPDVGAQLTAKHWLISALKPNLAIMDQNGFLTLHAFPDL